MNYKVAFELHFACLFACNLINDLLWHLLSMIFQPNFPIQFISKSGCMQLFLPINQTLNNLDKSAINENNYNIWGNRFKVYFKFELKRYLCKRGTNPPL